MELVREHGVRVLLVEPAFTNTTFDANVAVADQSLALYARRHEIVTSVLADAVKAGDDPTVASDANVAAASDTRPKLRYPAGKLASRVSKARRYAPAAICDRQIGKLNQLAG